MDLKLKDKREIALAASRPRDDSRYSWLDNPDVQKLLDVIASIIADEYIQIAKQNPDTFSNTGGLK